jgi:ubiquinone/menaquinone biosynthesis C-methylase UbiE
MTTPFRREEHGGRAGINYERLYDYRLRRVDPDKRRAIWREIAAYLYEQMGSPKRILDPAAGRGEFISAVPAEERWAVDLVAHAGDYGPDVRTIIADIFETDLPEQRFDGIFVSNFLEHLATQDEVAAFLDRMYRAASPGGVITVLGPNSSTAVRSTSTARTTSWP